MPCPYNIMTNDILNIESTPEIIGKPVGSDQAHKKITGPSLIGLEEAKVRAAKLIDCALEALTGFGGRALARYVVERKK